MVDAILDDSGSAVADLRRPTLRAPAILLGVILFVGGSSAYDGYLVVRTGDMIGDFERNPIGRFLIEYNNGDPSLFLRVKAAGTVLALSALSLLHRRSLRLASPVEVALVAFQSGLLFYLENPFG